MGKKTSLSRVESKPMEDLISPSSISLACSSPSSSLSSSRWKFFSQSLRRNSANNDEQGISSMVDEALCHTSTRDARRHVRERLSVRIRRCERIEDLLNSNSEAIVIHRFHSNFKDQIYFAYVSFGGLYIFIIITNNNIHQLLV